MTTNLRWIKKQQHKTAHWTTSMKWKTSVERGLRVLSCYPGCNSETNYNSNLRFDLYHLFQLAGPSKKRFRTFSVLYILSRHVLWWVKITNFPQGLLMHSTRFFDSQHPFAIKLEKCRTSSFSNLFTPLASRNWYSFSKLIIFNLTRTRYIYTYVSSEYRRIFQDLTGESCIW